MNFLEKDLENIIWGNYDACIERGLEIADIGDFTGQKRFRQLNLGPYGIADLVNLSFEYNTFTVQVIECKKEEINLDTYLQAKRYVTAIRHLLSPLEKARNEAGEGLFFEFECILIGRTFNKNNDFVFVLNEDDNCHAFLYDYKVDGIGFEEVGKEWRRANLEGHQSAIKHLNTAAQEAISERLADLSFKRQHSYEQMLLHGDNRLPLLITPHGVLVNEVLICKDANSARYDF